MVVNMATVTFTVIPRKSELIVPAQPTPVETKAVSDIDDQDSLRFHVPVIIFYKNNPRMAGVDPAKVVREALAKTLVYYYPYAGRLIEGPDHRLMVDCTAEGVLFLEADASVALDELGDTVQPPCQYPQLLLFDLPGFQGILGCPLMLLQVTRFKCGGFALAIRFNHVLSDAFGSFLFAAAMGELAKGASTPSILPVWKRELLTARHPPNVTHTHPEYEADLQNDLVPSALTDKNIVKREFSFGPEEIKAIRRNLRPEVSSCTTFELIAACLWRSRTRALQYNPDDNVAVTCPVDIRSKRLLGLPMGYYGNAIICPAKVCTVKALCSGPLEYAVNLVSEVKKAGDRDHVRSTIDLITMRGSSAKLISPWNFIVTDASKLPFDKVDFGWGKAIYGGTMYGGILNSSIFARYRNNKGEDVVVTPMTMPIAAMERFQNELRTLIYGPSKL